MPVSETDVRFLAAHGAEYETIVAYIQSHDLPSSAEVELINLAARYTM